MWTHVDKTNFPIPERMKYHRWIYVSKNLIVEMRAKSRWRIEFDCQTPDDSMPPELPPENNVIWMLDSMEHLRFLSKEW